MFAVCVHDWDCPADKPKCNTGGTCVRESNYNLISFF